MSCGCENNSGSTNGIKTVNFDAATYPTFQEKGVGNCASNKGKFYDKLIEDFILPVVGGEAFIKVCDASLWAVGQYIAINIGYNKIMALKISGIGAQKIKVINGCDNSGDNEIVDNPAPGTEAKAGSVLFPIVPSGCSSDFASIIITTFEEFGVEALMRMLTESDEICFTHILADGAEGTSLDGGVHLMGGTLADDGTLSERAKTCLRKILKIFTGSGGSTLCFPNIPETTMETDDDGLKKIAVFIGNKCLRIGPTLGGLINVGTFNTIAPDLKIDNPIVANDGELVKPSPTYVDMELTTKDFGVGVGFKWFSRKKLFDYAVVQHTVPTQLGAHGGGAVTASASTWSIRPLNTTLINDTSLISLSSSTIQILKDGVFLIKWSQQFYNCGTVLTAIKEVSSGTDLILGDNAYAGGAGGAGIGSAIIIVPYGSTRSFNLVYRALTSSAASNALGVGYTGTAIDTNVFANVTITRLK